MTPLEDLQRVFDGSDGDATRQLYQALKQKGPAGVIAENLFRALKASVRAKIYRRGSSRRAAYDRKQWSIDNLTGALGEWARAAGIVAWGWREDPAQAFHRQVLYIDLPTGQVSFHAQARGAGPDYPGHWDGAGASAARILRYCVMVLEARPITVRPYLFDGPARHLVCLPYTPDGLHAMAREMAIDRQWFHRGRWPHYDVPLRRISEIVNRPDVEIVTSRELLRRIKADQALRRARPAPAAMPTEQLGLL